MAQDFIGTKQALLEAAGELFSESGLDGASIRSIAEKVGANIAAINYHFGSKENLYTEVLRFVLTHSRCDHAAVLLEDESWSKTADGKAQAIRELVFERFRSYFSPSHPHWHARLVMRSMLDPTPSLATVVEQVMLPEHVRLKKVLQRCRPDFSEVEAQMWAFSLIGQIAFYVFGEAAILQALGKDAYDGDFIERAANHVSGVMISALGLQQL
jgi:AcrR family transcriptional regulator